ncbi:MAG: hypothetical protein RQ990_05115 [Candidatus Hydrothermia bacterium]|jgi:hypothetical protein|nr:hypothetical protein [Candidatus Hydrothermia bacterium]
MEVKTMNNEIEKIFQVASEEIDKISGPINDDMVFRIVSGTARELGYRISIYHYSQTIKFTEFSDELLFFDNFQDSFIGCYVIEYEILLDIGGKLTFYEYDGGKDTYKPILNSPSNSIAYQLLKHALSTAKFQTWKKEGREYMIDEVLISDFMESSAGITSLETQTYTYSSGELKRVKKFVIIEGSSRLRWIYRTLNSKTDLISYSKDYLFTSDSPIFVKLVFNKSFLDDKLEPSGPSNLELIRSLKGYITCTMKTLKKIEKV